LRNDNKRNVTNTGTDGTPNKKPKTNIASTYHIQADNQKLYWEKQMNKLCAMHTINELSGGPVFTYTTLRRKAEEVWNLHYNNIIERSTTSGMTREQRLANNNAVVLRMNAWHTNPEQGSYSMDVVKKIITNMGHELLDTIQLNNMNKRDLLSVNCKIRTLFKCKILIQEVIMI